MKKDRAMSDPQQLCTFFLNRLFFGVEVHKLITGVHKLKDRLLLVLDTEKTINLSHYGLHAA